MKVAQRIHVHSWLDDKAFARATAFCLDYRDCMDEITLFTDDSHHGYRPLETIREYCAVMRKRLEWFRENGFKSVGVNVLCTIGHVDEAFTCFDSPFVPITGFDGRRSKSCFCPEHKDLQAYVEEKYRIMAETNPDFLWVDDDIRFFINGVRSGCFCDACVARMSAKTGVQYTRETLAKAINEPNNVALLKIFVQDV